MATDSESPRFEPVTREEYTALRQRLGSPATSPTEADLAIARTWALSPGLMAAQTPLQRYIFTETPVSPRLRELAVLRIGWRCRAPYEFGQHVLMGRDAGLTVEEIDRLATTDPGEGWAPDERSVIDAVDQLHATHDVDDELWDRLVTHFDQSVVIDLISIIGRYWTVSVMTRTLRLPLDPGMTAFPPGHDPRNLPDVDVG